MNSAEFRLLIHHHDVAYVDEQGTIWLSAFIGRWVIALADHFQQIGLLLHQSESKLPKQDTAVNLPNVKLHSFGRPGKYFDHFFRLWRIRRVCSAVGEQYDGLLVRGVTPRQAAVWKNTHVNNKAYFLVGSLSNYDNHAWNQGTYIMKMIRAARLRGLESIFRDKPAIFVNSTELIGEVKNRYSLEATFIPTNSIRLQEFTPYSVKPLHSPLRLLYVGRMDLKKGLRELIEGLAMLIGTGIDSRLEIVAGEREPEQTMLTKLARQLGVEDKITWRGFIPYGESLFDCYREADFFVLPSYTEGFPHVLWEAAGNCCAIIATPVGGIPAILHNNIHAVHVKTQSAREISGAVNLLVEQPELRARIIQNAYDLAKKFTVEACAEQLASRLRVSW